MDKERDIRNLYVQRDSEALIVKQEGCAVIQNKTYMQMVIIC